MLCKRMQEVLVEKDRDSTFSIFLPLSWPSFGFDCDFISFREI